MVDVLRSMVYRVGGIDLVVVEACNEEEKVCYSPLGVGEYTYMYKLFVRKFGVVFPFSNFQCSVLSTINCAPSQLHPNGWAFVHSF